MAFNTQPDVQLPIFPLTPLAEPDYEHFMGPVYAHPEQYFVGEELVEALIARDSAMMLEYAPDASTALRGIRRKHERDAAVADGVYRFMQARGLVPATVIAKPS